MSSTAVLQPGTGSYPLTSLAVEVRNYDPVLVAKWRARNFNRKMRLQDFATSAYADDCGGRILKNLDVRIVLNGKRKRFFVDPQDKAWFDRLRSQIAIALEIGEERYPAIVVTFPQDAGGHRLSGVHEDLDKLASLGPNRLAVSLASSAASGAVSLLPPAPVYHIPRGNAGHAPQEEDDESSAALSSSPRSGVDENTISPAEARKLMRELVGRIRDGVSRDLPERILKLQDRDYGTVRAAVMEQLSSPDFYGGKAGYNAFWASSRCQDVGAAITDLSSDIASKVCKIGESFAPGEALPAEVYRSALVGCSIWDDWTGRMRRWKCRKPCRTVIPGSEYPGAGYGEERLYEICSPIGARAVDAIQTDLIGASLRCPYTEPAAHHCRGDDAEYSSDEGPSHESITCARRKKHYRCKHRQLAPNSTYYTVPPRATELPGEPACIEKKKKHRHHHQRNKSVAIETVSLVPIQEDQLAYIGAHQGAHRGRGLTLGNGSGKKPSGRGASPSSPRTGKTVPHGDANTITRPSGPAASGTPSYIGEAIAFEQLKPIQCKTCGHGCAKCGTHLCHVCNKCPVCDRCGHGAMVRCKMCANELPAGVQDIACPYCRKSTEKKKKETEEQEKPVVQVSKCEMCNNELPAGVKDIACGACRLRSLAKKNSSPEGEEQENLGSYRKAVVETESAFRAPSRAGLAGASLPPHGEAAIEVSRAGGKADGPDAVNIRYAFVNARSEQEPFLNLKVGDTQRRLVKAGKYRVWFEDAETGAKLCEEPELLVIQRNSYRLRFDPATVAANEGKSVACDKAVFSIVDRFESQKLALASKFMARADIDGYLAAHPKGVLFAPSDSVPEPRDVTLKPELFFASSEDPIALMKAETASKELRIVTDGKRAYIRNSENTKVWNSNEVRHCDIQGTAKHPKYAGVIVVIVDVLPTDVDPAM